MSGQPQVGDRVRVTYEGEYREIAGGLHRVKTGTGHVYAPWDAVIEVLPKPIKVGDTIHYAADLRRLPPGSLVENFTGEPVFISRAGRVTTTGNRIGFDSDGVCPYTVKYIPD